MVSQTERTMGTVGFADPAVIDPTTSKPYTPEASKRQTEEIFRQGKTKEEVNKLQLPKNIKKEVSEKLDLKVPTEEGILRPRARPEGLPTVYETLTPVDKVLELGYLLKEKQSGARGKTKIATGLNVSNPDHQKTIKGFFDNAVGGDTGYDPTKEAWCAAFVNHILTEMGADLIESEDDYKRLRANEYKNYGKPVKLEDIQEGDIVVFDWPDPETGKKDGIGDHVTFYAGGRIVDKGYGQYINVLGGNQQGGIVSVKENEEGYTLDNVIAIRRITYDGDAYKIAQSHKDSDPVFKTFIPKKSKGYFDDPNSPSLFDLLIPSAEAGEAPSTFGGRNRGGLEVGYKKGGLSAQTEEAIHFGSEITEVMDDTSSFTKSRENPDKDFNKGGTIMNRQMEMAFMREGGLRDDGMDVDPVSGNEVPPGSMAKEVRDDIPARLSEGEYVVPADVVQYYGVKFFEDLRADAKIGLQEMESNGRIGGEPVDDDLSDEEMMEIQTMMQGGMVQPQQQSDPYLQQNMMYQQPQGMAVGGLSQEQITTPGPFPSVPRYTGEFSWEKPVSATTAPVDTETPSIENCAKKGQDYDPVTKTCVPRTEVQPVQDTGGDDRPPVAEPDPNAWMEKYDYANQENLIKQTQDNITKSQLPGILSGGVFGALDAGGRAAQTAANIVLLQAQGVDTADLVDVWNANKPSYLPNFAINGDQLARQASIAHGIELDRDAKDIFGKDIFTDNSYARYKRDYDAKGHKPREKTPTPSVASKNQISQDGNSQDKQPTAIQKATIAKAKDKKSDYGFDPSVKKSKAPATAKKSYVKSTYTPSGKYAEDEKFGALNKGGLMKKKKK